MFKNLIKKSIVGLVVLLLPFFSLILQAQAYYMYVGTYTLTPGGGEGIYRYRFSAYDGTLTFLSVTKNIANPSFLITDAGQKHLYAVNEEVTGGQRKGGAVSSFSINRKTGDLTFLSSQSTTGGGPCHLTLDHSGKWLYTANYGGGSITVFPVMQHGIIGKYSYSVQHTGHGYNKARQAGPHVHEVVMDPVDDLLYTPDLGLDKVFIYQVNSTGGKLLPWKTPFIQTYPGSGPRHIAFTPDRKKLYVLQEMASQITIFSVSSDRTKWTKVQQLSLLPPGTDQTGNTGAELQIAKNGKYLYASNRGHNSIAFFQIKKDGQLVRSGDFSCGGKTPRFFTLDPTGKFLIVLNQDSGNIVIFTVNKNGSLQKTNIDIRVPKPVCAVFVPQE